MRSIIWFLLTLTLGMGYAVAQSGLDCPVFVQQAMQRLEENCDGLDRNRACYGYFNVQAEVVEEVDIDVFNEPADIAALADLLRIQTTPYDIETEQWGLAAMQVQANLPGVIPGQAAIILLIGEASIEDAVPGEDVAFPLDDPIQVTAAADVNLRSGPGLSYPVVTSVASGAALGADGIHETDDYGWLRVVYGDQFGWVSRDLLNQPVPTQNDLPLIGPGHYTTPMQAFYMRTGLGNPECAEAPDLMMVQGPDRTAIDISANGADIRVTSTILLRTVSPGDQLQIITLSGTATIDNVLDVPRSFTAYAPIDPATGQITGAWSEPRLLTSEEIAALGVVEQIPVSLLHYPPRLPGSTELAELEQAYSYNAERGEDQSQAATTPLAPEDLPPSSFAASSQASADEQSTGSGSSSAAEATPQPTPEITPTERPAVEAPIKEPEPPFGDEP